MQKIFFSIIVLLSLLLTGVAANTAIVIPGTTIPRTDKGIYAKLSSLKIKDIQHLSGRKLTLKEKIAFLLLKHKLKHQSRDEKKLGNTALTWALIGLGLLIAGLFIPSVILGSLIAAILAVALGSLSYKRDRSDKKAHTAKIIGWLTLAVIALFLILAAIIISSWTSGF